MLLVLGMHSRHTMRIWLLSDLHQEFLRDPEAGSHPLTRLDPEKHRPDSFDVVVLAGDIDVPLTRSIRWAADRFAGVPIVYVPGNHDYYVGPGDPVRTIDELQAEGMEAAARYGVHLLLDNAIRLAGARFLGATLWTDFRLGPGNQFAHIAEARGRMGMNDYREIKRWSSTQPGKRKRLRPEDTIEAHQLTRGFLRAALAEPTQEPTVVVTHHAPLAESIDLRRRLAWCYASEMDHLFDGENAPALWLHGHIHDPVDYLRGRTRIVSNPRGYAFAERSRKGEFDPCRIVEVAI